jgi:hypothetical protein
LDILVVRNSILEFGFRLPKDPQVHAG